MLIFTFKLNKAGTQLKILPHKVINDAGEEIELCSSVECKGIIGNDSRHYVLDLLRTFPPDVNFLKRESRFTNFTIMWKISFIKKKNILVQLKVWNWAKKHEL